MHAASWHVLQCGAFGTPHATAAQFRNHPSHVRSETCGAHLRGGPARAEASARAVAERRSVPMLKRAFRLILTADHDPHGRSAKRAERVSVTAQAPGAIVRKRRSAGADSERLRALPHRLSSKRRAFWPRKRRRSYTTAGRAPVPGPAVFRRARPFRTARSGQKYRRKRPFPIGFRHICPKSKNNS